MSEETRLAEVVNVYPAAAGRTTASIRCPFCDCVVQARTWSLAGSGKRCYCGAVLQGLTTVGPTHTLTVTARKRSKR